VTVPDVVGLSSTDAVERLAEEKLKAHTVSIDSTEPEGQVVSQAPAKGAEVDEGTRVTIRVSKGPQPVGVPDVRGSNVLSAISMLQAKGFAVSRRNVESDQPADTVLAQDPAAGTFQPPGTTITLTVSKGPKEATVPDVSSFSQSDAQAQLTASGFRVRIENEPTTDPDSDGKVLSQDPSGGTQAPRGSTVTISVGKLEGTPGPGP